MPSIGSTSRFILILHPFLSSAKTLSPLTSAMPAWSTSDTSIGDFSNQKLCPFFVQVPGGGPTDPGPLCSAPWAFKRAYASSPRDHPAARDCNSNVDL
ncbi:hypothetical protein DFS33DRAFT_1365596 [Desarmillaria ectypa]|nr:hypothetical protein DFS33DRAFT_1365596 [Desarmillaria ectypa]